MQGRKKKIMYFATVSKSHFMLCWVDIHVDQCRIDLEVEHKSGVTTVIQHITIGLLNRVRDQLIANHSTIHKKVLQIRLRPREGGQPDPAAQSQAAAFRVNVHDLIDKRRAANSRHATLLRRQRIGKWQIESNTAVMRQAEGDVEARQGQTLYHLF